MTAAAGMASGRSGVMFDERTFIEVDPVPCYRKPGARLDWAARREWARTNLGGCQACPRACGANRSASEVGLCGVDFRVRVASVFPHHGEERCLSGTRGSGTIFFSGCNLGCVFCQNWDISQQVVGEECPPEKLAQLMLDLQSAGCHNINLVTPSHVVPQIIPALELAIAGGLSLPVVYNSSGYDAPEALEILDGLIDVYMPDFKFWKPGTAERLAKAPDYPERARAALRIMHRQVGDLRFTPEGLACRGLLVRHLVLPGLVDESREILHWLAEAISPHTFVNIMGQYRPENEVGRTGACAPRYGEINRRPSPDEVKAAHQAARAAGLWRFDS